MIKLICQSCKKSWYTADGNSENNKCDDCGGELIEDNSLQDGTKPQEGR